MMPLRSRDAAKTSLPAAVAGADQSALAVRGHRVTRAKHCAAAAVAPRHAVFVRDTTGPGFDCRIPEARALRRRRRALNGHG
ncbi:hypothetical protein MRX96_037394 [Rhipicephalus microplus]